MLAGVDEQRGIPGRRIFSRMMEKLKSAL